MWGRFTERARVAVWRAKDEATSLGAGAIGAEHLFLALLHDPESVASRALQECAVTADTLRKEVLARVKPSANASPEEMHFTPRFKHVLECAYQAAWDLNNNYIGTEHLLLGTLKSEGSLGAMVLRDAGIEYAAALERVRNLRDSLAQQSSDGD